MKDKKKTVLITGASGGIGREFAYIFARKGCDLILVARSQDKLEQLADDCVSKHGVHTTVLVYDLSRPASAEDLYHDVRQRGLRVDVLINNAGFGHYGPLLKDDFRKNTEMIILNVTSLVTLTTLFVKEMAERNHGQILNVASTAAFQPVPNFAVYGATKAFVLSFTEALHYELRNTQVTVSALCPGPTSTGFEKAADMEGSKLFKSGVMSAQVVAEIGYKGLQKGKMTIVPGLKNKMMAIASNMTPSRDLLVWVAGKMS